jgi:hypothetical protein
MDLPQSGAISEDQAAGLELFVYSIKGQLSGIREDIRRLILKL